MFSVAYRMLGSVAEAEDVVQEALLRLHTAPDDIRSPEAYAVTVTTRLAIDELRSARRRREHYTGTWLPEPLVTTGDEADPAVVTGNAAEISLAFLVLLERLSPVERAVLILREAFGYDYDEIAAVVERSAATCRQALHRARARLGQENLRFESEPRHQQQLVGQFLRACSSGDLDGLQRLLAEDVTFYADGGGKAAAVTSPVRGRVAVARFVLGLTRYAGAHGLRIEPVVVNADAGARLLAADGTTLAVLALHITHGTVRSLYNVVNPDKLRHLSPPEQN